MRWPRWRSTASCAARMPSRVRAAICSSAKTMPCAYAAVAKSRPIGSAGNFPAKNNQSTARLSANSAAEPAKTNSTMSASPQIRRTMESRRTKSVIVACLSRAHRAPPWFHHRHRRGLHRFARARHDELRARGSSRGYHTVRRLIPRVKREVERAPVNRQHHSPPHLCMDVDRLFGGEVDIGPGLAVRADLDECEIERPVLRADLGEAGEGPRVAAVKDAMT